MSPTPIRVIVSEQPDGWRRVELRCCARLGRTLAIWESVPDTVAGLLAEHDKLAPRCQHPRPLVGARP